MSQVARATVKVASVGRPIKSQTPTDARRAVLSSYKKWQRALPRVRDDHEFFDFPMPTFRLLIKEQFTRNAHIHDIRVIDRLVAKADTELFNTIKTYNNPDHLRNYLIRANIEHKPKDFLSKFFAGKD
jgi:NADH dehydrogenase (ubiquinone) 1 alpha subcomplex subunit 6